ncbi:hypothetical protein F4825DRAFT_449228 [Nemania diffusa]|nr:hypothetical protein F4825DRAFT_449228 [Nemania diffusa]
MPEPAKGRVPNRLNTAASRMPPSRAPIPPAVDRSSPAYKAAASKYTRLMISMPILLVTSYYLYDRLALGHEVKPLPSRPSKGEVDKEARNLRSPAFAVVSDVCDIMGPTVIQLS